MKLIDMNCPHCGAHLKVDADNSQAICEHCGATILIDDEVQHIQYDNAEEAGYNFEKGRQRAQAEASASRTTNQPYPQPPKKKRKTWLWVLGWIIIFPVPLTILMLRKKDMKPAIKYGIMAAAWLVYLVIGIAGGAGETGTETAENNQVETTETVPEDSNGMQESEERIDASSDDMNNDATDEIKDTVVNRFVTEFNNTYDDSITNISKGNIRTKYYGYVRDTRLEMVNANGAAAEVFSVSIYGGQEESDRDAMFSAFTEIVKILDPSIADETIKGAIEELVAADVLTENYPLGNTLSVTYVPIKELSYGKNECRVDVSASDYKETATTAENTAIEEPIEMNSLQILFASLTNETTREEVDAYIGDNNMVKYAFTQDSAYYIGYESSAIRKRGRDRVGEAVDINFVTSGDPNQVGKVKSAEYAIHTEASTHYALKFENGKFYYEGKECSTGEEAMQQFLEANR